MVEAIRAESWALYELDTNSFVRGRHIDTKRQIASLTKMFTLAVCLQLEKKLQLDRKMLLRIQQQFPTGTTAGLVKNHFMSIEDLYHGMMLPSGNDASLVLATYFGWFIAKPPIATHQWDEHPNQPKFMDVSGYQQHIRLYQSKFIHEMNRTAKQLGLESTSFDNPHGLANKYNVSSVGDLAVAVHSFLKIPDFRDITSTLSYSGKLRNSLGEVTRILDWENTNALLKEGYTGVKTGFTSDAGGCLVATMNISYREYHRQCLMVVLGSSNQQTRFSDVRAIVSGQLRYLDLMSA